MLQIGAERFTDSGWFSTDLFPTSPGVQYLDATKRWPFADECLDAIVCEHMIEHVSVPEGAAVLKEAFRVLKPGGALRVVTPDIALVAALLQGEEREYARWSNNIYGGPNEGSNPIFTVNRMMREWGHTFIYDEATLRSLLANAGFKIIEKFPPGESNNNLLRKVERHGETIGERWNIVESMVLEATKLMR